VRRLSEILLSVCKELIDDARVECTDLGFKDICLEILAKARLVLSKEQFEELVLFVTEILKKEMVSNPGRKIRIL
jgi:dsDNA-binding SOS-regulon protein